MSTTLDDLRYCLDHELDLVRQFLDVLRDESQALAQPDNTATLAVSTRKKDHFAEQLAQAAKVRESLLAELGLDTDKTGLDQAIRQNPALEPTCAELFSLAEQARRQNAENGAIIEIYLAHNQRAIKTLRSLAGTGNLYDAKGQARP